MWQECVDNAYGVPALSELAVDVVVRGAVDHEHLRHVVGQQLTRVAYVYCRFWTQKVRKVSTFIAMARWGCSGSDTIGDCLSRPYYGASGKRCLCSISFADDLNRATVAKF